MSEGALQPDPERGSGGDGGRGPERTIVSVLLEHVAQRGDETCAWFLSEEGELALSWRELMERACRMATLYRERGIGPGEIAFLVLPLGPDVPAAFVGALLSRVVPSVLAYPSPKVLPEIYARNLRGIVEITGTRTFLTTRALEPALREHLPEDCRLLWAEDAAALSPQPAEEIAKTAAHLGSDDVAFLQHSSGSTGIQKGVAVTHTALLNLVRHYANALALDPSRDVIASWLPLYHDMGLIGTLLLPMIVGTRVVYMDPFRWVVDPALLLEAMTRHRATLTWLPNFAYNHLARRVSEERLRALDLSGVRGFINGSEPVREASHRAFLERFARVGVRPEMLWTCYGMAENTMVCTQTGGAMPQLLVDWIDPAPLASEGRAVPVAPGEGLSMVSCGVAIEGAEVGVVDAERRPLPERRVGEVTVRSDSLMTGYHKNPDATRACLEGGVFYSGDYGYLAGGHLFITGRKKDLIIVGGRNFYPQDLEMIANEQPGVVPGRTVAFGLEDEALGTEVVVVVAETESSDETARTAIRRGIQQTALERLDCAVGRVELVPRGFIVKTSSGKIARAANLERYRALLAERAREARPAAAAAAVAADAPPEPIALLLVRVLAAALVLTLASLLFFRGANVYAGF